MLAHIGSNPRFSRAREIYLYISANIYLHAHRKSTDALAWIWCKDGHLWRTA